MYLHRSGAAPIDLRIDIGRLRDTEYPEDIGGFCQILTPHLSRCNRLVVDADYYGCSDELPKLFHCLRNVSAPLLRAISINCPSEEYGRIFLARGPIFTGGTPLLTLIRLQNIALEFCLPPLESVTVMRLRSVSYHSSGITADEWVAMISSARSLLHLEMDSDMLVEDWDVSTAVEMPLFQKLCLRAVGDGQSTFHGF